MPRPIGMTYLPVLLLVLALGCACDEGVRRSDPCLEMADLGAGCVVGEGECSATGTYGCTEDGDDLVCNATPGDATDEVCDGLDNDCDSETDEGLTAPADLCLSQGVCASGTTSACTSGIWSCDYSGATGYEQLEFSCDGLDNDCDGLVDEEDVCVVTPTPLPAPMAWFAIDEGTGQILQATQGERFLRGIWEHINDSNLPGIPTSEAAGLAEIQSRVNRMATAGLNSVSLWAMSRMVEAERGIEPDWTPGPLEQLGEWGCLEKYAEAAREKGLFVMMWYSPIYYKNAHRASELLRHPEWQLKYLDGSGAEIAMPAVDLAHPAALAYQLEMIQYLAKHYSPDAILIEEPYYPGTTGGNELVITSAPFADRFQTKFGYPSTQSHPSRNADLLTLKKEIISGLMEQIHTIVRQVDPAIVVAADGPPTVGAQFGGMDLLRYHQEGWLDAYGAQTYVASLSSFNSHTSNIRDDLADRISLWEGINVVCTCTTDTSDWCSPWQASPTIPMQQLASVEGATPSSAVDGSILFAFRQNGFDCSENSMENYLALNPQAPWTARLGTTTSNDLSDPTWVSPPALQFDGVDDHVWIPPAWSLDTYSNLTFSVWVRFTQKPAATWSTLYSRGVQDAATGYHWIYLHQDGMKLSFQISDGTQVQVLESPPLESQLLDGAWHHLAVTQDRLALSVAFFLDGEEQGRVALSSRALPVVKGHAWIGTYDGSTSANYLFHGALKDLRLYRQAFTPDQVARLAANP